MITEGLLDTLLQGVNMKQQEDSSSLETIQRLVQENQRLTSENQRLAQENQRLHEQIGLLRKREWQHQLRLGVTSLCWNALSAICACRAAPSTCS